MVYETLDPCSDMVRTEVYNVAASQSNTAFSSAPPVRRRSGFHVGRERSRSVARIVGTLLSKSHEYGLPVRDLAFLPLQYDKKIDCGIVKMPQLCYYVK